MVLGRTQFSYRNRCPAPGLSPVRPLKDHRCAGCRFRDAPTKSPKHCLETCPRQLDFAPTPNRFSILAELDQASVEPNWAFDFAPIPTTGTRRLGKRARKHHAVKHTVRNKHENSESMIELCSRIAALRLDNNGPLQAPQQAHCDHQTTSAQQVAFLAESDRNNWSSQFFPNVFPVPLATAATTASSRQPVLAQPPKPCRSPFQMSPSGPADQETKLGESPLFSLSEFHACSDPTERYPSTKFSDYAHKMSEEFDPRLFQLSTTPNHARTSAISAVCYALALRTFGVSPSPLNNVPCGQEVGLHSSPQLAQHLSLQDRPVALERASTIATLSSESRSVSQLPSPLAVSLEPKLFMDQTPSSFAPRWTEPTDGITIFNPSLSPLVTTPAAPPHLFINVPNRQPSCNPFERSFAIPTLASRRLVLQRSSAEVQQELEDFLNMGHANPCWCSRHAKLTTTSCDTLEVPHAPSSEEFKAFSELKVKKPTGPSPEAADAVTRSDTELTTMPRSSDNSESVFEDLCDMMRSNIPIDDDWIVVSPDHQYRTPRSHITGQPQSYFSLRPLPPFTPSWTPRYTASDPGTDVPLPNPWILSPAESVWSL